MTPVKGDEHRKCYIVGDVARYISQSSRRQEKIEFTFWRGVGDWGGGGNCPKRLFFMGNRTTLQILLSESLLSYRSTSGAGAIGGGKPQEGTPHTK